ncbi:hypothetical protein L7F22_016808 [Adiantum nelumboides]|nr:hypothetical protein [Adiantum nelumboides]
MAAAAAAPCEEIVDGHTLGFSGTYRKINTTSPHNENIASDITQLIGWTPLVDLKNIASKEGAVARIVGKLECQQPLGSVKDRIGLPMIEDAEKRGLIKPGVNTLVEPTSGNTAIALACASIHKNYKVAAVMPASSSIERRMILRALGADVYLTDPALGFDGVFAKTYELLASIPNSHMLNQLNNANNPAAHFRTTGPEVWRDTAGKGTFLWPVPVQEELFQELADI